MLRLRPQFSLLHRIAVRPRSHIRLGLLHGIPSETLESSSSSNSDLTVLYLTNSCGLSPVAALSAAKKLRLRTTANADSVLNHLRDHGLNDSQIAKLITKSPVLLTLNSDKIIKPKLDFFLTAGFSAAAIAMIITANPLLLHSSLEKRLKPNYVLLKTIFGSAKEAARAISAESQLLYIKLPMKMLPNMKTLEEHGVPRHRIIRIAKCHPGVLLKSPAKFSKEVVFLKKTGFDPLKVTFMGAIIVMCAISPSTRERKLQLYRTLGWSKEDIDLMFKHFPFCLALSEEKIKQTMSFYVDKLKWKHSFLAVRSKFLTLSLQKTIIPRYNVFGLLESHGLAKRMRLTSLLQVSEAKFLNRFVIKYGEKVPEVLEAYKVKLDIARLKQSQIAMALHVNNNISS